MRLVYLGTPQVAVAPLVALHQAGHEIALVVTGADKRRGRGSAKTPTPVKSVAMSLGLSVSHDADELFDVEADLGVVVAYGRIIGPRLLDHLQMVNLHFSLLPRWRGAAPVERAILAGDIETGVCVMAVEEELDTGGIYAKARIPIGDATAEELKDTLASMGSHLLTETLARGLDTPKEQTTVGVTYADKIRPEDLYLSGDLDLEGFVRRVRVGGAWTTFRGRRLKVLAARARERSTVGGQQAGPRGVVTSEGVVHVSDGEVVLETVQQEGKAPMPAADWVRGARPDGDRIGD